MARPADRFPLVDGLRAVAAVAVLLTHSAFSAGLVAAGGEAARYAQRLEVGVAIFFVISGFVLYRPFLLARAEGRPPPLPGRYARRRALRIVPAYWLALTVSAIGFSLPGVFSTRGLPTYYGFAQIYSQDTLTGGLLQAWTLCIEVTFYAFLPLWAWLLRRFGVPEGRALVGLALASLAWKAAFVWSGSARNVVDTPWLHSLPAYLDHFALGMGLALLSVRGVRAPRWLPLAAVAVAALAFWVVSLHLGIGYVVFEPYTRWQFLGRHALYGLIGAALAAAALAAVPGRGAVGRTLGSPALRWLGLVSYGIYLWHVSVLRGMDAVGLQARLTWHPFLVTSVLALAGSAAIAAVSWYGFERPLLRAGSLPWRRRRPARA